MILKLLNNYLVREQCYVHNKCVHRECTAMYYHVIHNTNFVSPSCLITAGVYIGSGTANSCGAPECIPGF
jgi:hypothetical protein